MTRQGVSSLGIPGIRLQRAHKDLTKALQRPYKGLTEIPHTTRSVFISSVFEGGGPYKGPTKTLQGLTKAPQRAYKDPTKAPGILLCPLLSCSRRCLSPYKDPTKALQRAHKELTKTLQRPLVSCVSASKMPLPLSSPRFGGLFTLFLRANQTACAIIRRRLDCLTLTTHRPT